LGYDRLVPAKAIEKDNAATSRPCPILHGWQNTPIHQMGLKVDLDKRTPGAAVRHKSLWLDTRAVQF